MKPVNRTIKQLLTLVLLIASGTVLVGQKTIHGEVFDKNNSEPIIGAHVKVKNALTGAITEIDGTFALEVDKFPVTLLITYIGCDTAFVDVTDPNRHLMIALESSSHILDEILVEADAKPLRQKQSALNIESLAPTELRRIASHDYYEGLAGLKGVDATSAAMGFTIINTRGFNSTSPVRSLQIIDGVDNQSPGLNFSLGNFLGAPELDVLRVELIQGPVSAFYGPNAFNGVIDIRTRDPFIHQGLEACVKYGERNLLKGEFRYAKAFQNAAGADKFAFKINGAFMHAHDWEAINYDPTDQSLDDAQNPGGYDAVNIYGDENVAGRNYTGLLERKDYPGLKRFYRRGYAEADLVDYNSENYKGNIGLYYHVDRATQLIGGFNFGSGTTVYQGENRFRLEDIFFWQGKIELKRDGKFFLRAYLTEEDAGKTYDAYATALRLQTAAKTEDNWNKEYPQYWQSYTTRKVQKLPGYPPDSIPFDFLTQDAVLDTYHDSLLTWHAASQAYANARTYRGGQFFEPGTAGFDSMFNLITQNLSSDPENPGTRFYDKSGLFHVHGEYQFTPAFAHFTLGANFRQYNPDSKGTIFSDTSGRKIINREYGVYGGVVKDLIPENLRLNITARLDKNENFNPVVSPAVSLVLTPDDNNVFRISFSSALRNPTLADQYLYLDVGRALLLGNISGYDSLITPESFKDYLNTRYQDTLVYFDEPAIQPEKVKSIELGYRGTLFGRLWIDAGYYHSWYRDFIGYKIGISSDFTIWNSPINTKVLRVTANAASQVTTQGFTIGLSYPLSAEYRLSGNYSWNVLNKKGTEDPIIPAFNTPEHKFNLGFSGRDIRLPIGKSGIKSFGFNVNYKWIEGFLFEGSPQFTGKIPTYDLLDAQVNWHAERLGLTIKAGATNVLNKKQFQVYGGPRIGRLAYISFLYEGRQYVQSRK